MNIIEELRSERKMSQFEFAEFCGVSRTSIARYEAGKEISRENAKRIAAACNVSVDYLIGETTVISATGKAIPGLNADEQILVLNYRKLNPEGKDLILSYLSMLMEKAGYLR